jgi:hypothetical protein
MRIDKVIGPSKQAAAYFKNTWLITEEQICHRHLLNQAFISPWRLGNDDEFPGRKWCPIAASK